ncbi:BTAD domain-containing putative transcriptional regulator [Actinokineospora pegani]|uniref:BTAD domain-containing putative transcriptional regulator n=1 Tax=Actinokineospora pegani TaxID=2654637 RepID=UPI0018D3FD3B|nr:BTAD domain-containing putative transcriptional regulator [Actinokineospora pegani]
MAPEADLHVVLLGRPALLRGGERVPLGRGLPTAVLATLALQANQVVSKAELGDALWDGSPPRGARDRIYTYVSALRRAIHGDAHTGPDVLESGSTGYRLLLPPDALDSGLVRRHRDEARAHRGRGDAVAELSSVESALALWRGEALAGVNGPLAECWRTRMEEVRLGLRTRRAHLLVAAGRPGEVVDDLRDLAASHPAREDVYHSLMLALCRSGRPGEALEVYSEARQVLVDRFGTEPGAALRALRRGVLAAGSPRTARPAPAADGPRQVGAMERLSNARPVTFVGRAEGIERIRADVERVRAGRGGALWIDGAQGSGKSALMAEGLARALADTEDCVVGWGTADRATASVPFGGLQDCLAGIDPDLREQVGLSAPDAVTGGTGPRTEARLWLGAVISTVRALVESAGGRPVLLVIDDLHQADEETLLVWRHLLTTTDSLPLLLVSACRPLPRRRNVDLLRVLATESGCGHMELTGLDDVDVVDLLDRAHPGVRTTAALVATMSGGSPGFADAIARASLRRPIVDWPAIPAEVADKVHAHLATMSKATREMLSCAALLGDSHTVGDILRASGKRAHDLLNLVDEALTGGILCEVDGARLRFRHPVVRRVLAEAAQGDRSGEEPAAEIEDQARHDGPALEGSELAGQALEGPALEATMLSTYGARPAAGRAALRDHPGAGLVPVQRAVPRPRQA